MYTDSLLAIGLAESFKSRIRRQRSNTPYTKKLEQISLMATFWRTQLVIVSINIFLVVLFVAASKDSCASVFETQLGK